MLQPSSTLAIFFDSCRRAAYAPLSNHWLHHNLVGIVLLLLLVITPATFAAEVDSFTNQHLSITDSLKRLNQEVNSRLLTAIDKANTQAGQLRNRRHPKTKRPIFPNRKGLTYCNRQQLVNAIDSALGGPIIGELEQWAEESHEIDKITVPYEASIYQTFLLGETPSISGSKRLASVLRLNQLNVGTDKLGHFFTEGGTYYKRLERGDNLNKVLKFGEQTEIVIFGSVTTGVYSYADLAANFNGLRFWRALFSEHPDPLNNRVTAPYVRCISQQWQLERNFDWQDYIDLAWDESRNCNQFRNPTLLGKIEQHLIQLPQQHHCALKETDIAALKTKYGQHFTHIVNTDGLSVLPEEKQAYTLLDNYIQSPKGQRKPQWIIRVLSRFRDKVKDLLIGNSKH